MITCNVQSNTDAERALRELDELIFAAPRSHLHAATPLEEVLQQPAFDPAHYFQLQLQIALAEMLVGENESAINRLYHTLPRHLTTTNLRNQREYYQAWIDTYRSILLLITGEYGDVQRLLQHSLELFRAANDWRGIIITEATFAIFALLGEQHHFGLDRIKLVNKLLATLPDGAAIGSRVFGLSIEAFLRVGTGDALGAKKRLNEAYNLAREHELDFPHIYSSFAELATLQGDYETAEKMYHKALETSQALELGDRFIILFEAHYARFFLRTNQAMQARDAIDAVLQQLASDQDAPEPNCTVLKLAAEIYEHVEDWEKAFTYYERYVKIDLRQQRSSLHHMHRLRNAALELATLEREAHHDALTGLLNRKGFLIATESVRSGLNWGMLLIDTDYFKRINDTYGHLKGDSVLERLGAILQHNTPDTCIVARFGGEEFAVFVPGAPETLAQLAERYLHAVRSEPWHDLLPGVALSISIGGAHARDGAENVLTRADQAMYQAKHYGRGQYQFVK